MEKASKAIRRSGVRIRSIGSGHSDLQMVISQMKDLKNASKMFTQAQSEAMQDLVKWSLKGENRAIADALSQVGELFAVWSEVQREFTENWKEFRHQFDMILEGDRQLDFAKCNLQDAEQKENKLKKELKKTAKRATPEELREMSTRLQSVEREKDVAQLEVLDRVREHEAVKLIRVKEGLFKISEAYVDMGQKCDVIFSAQRDIALQLPDVHDRDIQDIKYTGSGATMRAVIQAKDKIKRFRRRNSSTTSHPCVVDDLPPPYCENPPPVNPFYNSSSIPASMDNSHNLDESGGVDPHLVVSSPMGRDHTSCPQMYPVLPNIPPYQGGIAVPPYQHIQQSSPPPFNAVPPRTSMDRFHRRNSYFSDTEEFSEAVGNLNLNLK